MGDANITRESYLRLRNFVKQSCYEEVLEILKEEDVDIDAMSSGQKWKAVVEYCLEEMERFQEEQYGELTEKLEVVFREIASKEGVNYDELDEEGKNEFFDKVIDGTIPKLKDVFGISERELMELDDDELCDLAIQYLVNGNGTN